MAKKKAKPDFSKPKENNQTAQENKKNSFDDLENQPDFIENLVSSEITVAPDGTVTVTGEASAENAEYEAARGNATLMVGKEVYSDQYYKVFEYQSHQAFKESFAGNEF